MKKLLLGLALLWATPALAVVPQTAVGDAAYTILGTDCTVATTTVFTAPRTWTLPFAGATQVGQSAQCPAQLQIIDSAGAIGQLTQLTIAPASGDTINGNTGNLIISGVGSRVVLVPTTGSNWQAYTVGDFVTSGACPSNASTATVTITIAAPGVITDTAHGLTGACAVVYTTDGALPTGITSGTTYWVVPSSITTNTYSIATTVANALAGTKITTSGTQSGTQTRTSGTPITSTTAANITGVSLSQGRWECRATISRVLASNTSVTVLKGGISATTATVDAQGTAASTFLQTAANVMGVLGQDTKVGPHRLAPTATTTYYLAAQDTFSVSTNNAYGAMTCLRVE